MLLHKMTSVVFSEHYGLRFCSVFVPTFRKIYSAKSFDQTVGTVCVRPDIIMIDF